MKRRTFVFASTCVVAFSSAWIFPAHAQQATGWPVTFTALYGNAVEQHTAGVRHGRGNGADALGVPLNYISGRPGNEVFLAFRRYGGSGFFNRKDRLYLQFRRGRLAGWKGDWGHNWMWR